MRAEVISPFRDKFHYNTLYEVGAVVDFDMERIESLIARKLCKPLEGEGTSPSPKVNDKETKKNGKGGKKNVLKDTEASKEEAPNGDEVKADETAKSDELDEKTKSEQEAAKKIAEATQKANEK